MRQCWKLWRDVRLMLRCKEATYSLATLIDESWRSHSDFLSGFLDMIATQACGRARVMKRREVQVRNPPGCKIFEPGDEARQMFGRSI